MRPLYCCLTEGSGGAASSRMLSTDVVLDRKIDAALQYPELHAEVHTALERFGEQRVREGRYTEIIRYRQHMLPVRTAIEAAVHGRVADATAGC